MRGNIEMAGLIIANTFSATSILLVAAMLTKTVSLYSTFTGIMSALAGFLTGAFLPTGMFPANIQKIFAFIPARHGAALMRRVMTREPLMATFGNVQVSFSATLIIVIGSGLLFLVSGIIRMEKYKKR